MYVTCCLESPQLPWTVAINVLFFFTSTVMATGDAAAGVRSVEQKLWPTLKVNWLVWPTLQAINFSIVPLPYRILFVNTASLFWSAYLSSMANNDVPVAVPVRSVTAVSAASAADGAPPAAPLA
ncbi:Mpv17/PMP22 family protein [archaeon]|nr:MAG: Mpv17/PMP22 family protein [archaeon]